MHDRRFVCRRSERVAHVYRRAAVSAAVFLSLAAGGCALGRDYRRPDVPVPALTRGQVSPTAESLADLGWWEVFRDPELRALIVEATAANHDLRAAAARVEQARQLVRVTRADLLPQVGAELDAGRERMQLRTGGATADGAAELSTFTGLVNLAWEIDLWGRIRRRTEASRARFWAAEDVRRGVWLSLVSDVAAAWLDLLELDAERRVRRDSVRSFGETEELFRRRFEGGIGTLLEVSRAHAARASAEAELPQLDREIAMRENQLSVLLGRPPGPIARSASLDDQHFLAAIPAGVPSQLLERRPDLLRAEHEVVAANAEVGAALASFFPRLGLTTFYGGQSGELGDLVKSGSGIWSVAGNVSQPIFQGGRLLASYRASDAALDEAVEVWQQSVLRAFAEVSDLLISHDRLRLVRARREEQVEQLETSVRLSLQRYRDGVASYIEVLEAQQLYFPARILHLRTRRDEMRTMVDLYRALGGGWQSPAGANPSPPA